MTKHINLAPVQQQFVNSDAWIVGFLADRAAGKTAAGAIKAIKKILQGESGVIVSPVLRRAAFPEFVKWAPMNLLEERNKKRPHPYTVQKVLKFNIDGKTVNVYYGDATSRMWRALIEVSWLWLDEGMGVEKREFDALHRRILRSSGSQAWITASDRDSPPWIDRLFMRHLLPEGRAKRGGRLISAYFPTTPQYNLTYVSPEQRALVEELYPSLVQDLDTWSEHE